MNRIQRRLGRIPKNESEQRSKLKQNGADVVEVLPPKNRRNVFNADRFLFNRCTSATPSIKDFGQLTESSQPSEKYKNILREQYGFQPVPPDTLSQLKELKKLLCNVAPKVENSSQYAKQRSDTNALCDAPTTDESQWQNVDTTDDIDNIISKKALKGKNRTQHVLTPPKEVQYLPTRVHIAETPRVKIIAEKFSKFKRNNIEVRKLDEKVVCLEYDVHDLDAPDKNPVKTMRAFFSIKPDRKQDINKNDKENKRLIPSDVKRKFNIGDDDLEKLNDKEIEIIDGKISENRPILEDLKRVLKRKQAIDHKKKQETLDLLHLYEMAKRDSPPLDDDFSNTNLLSKSELQEIKDLILKKCSSGANGINRRPMTDYKDKEVINSEAGIISDSMVKELLKEAEKDFMNV